MGRRMRLHLRLSPPEPIVYPADMILILGGSGLAGSAIRLQLSAVGLPFLAPARSELDLNDSVRTGEYIASHRPRLIIHAAAEVAGILRNQANPEFMFDANRRIDANVLAAARAVKTERLLYFASNCAYSPESRIPFREEDFFSGPVEPTNAGFAKAKRAAVEEIFEARADGLRWSAVVPASLYGPGDHFEEERAHVIPSLIRRFSEAKTAGAADVEVWGTGKALREFLFVTDFAKAVALIASRDLFENPLINIGGGAEISIANLAKTIARITAFTGRIKFLAGKPDGMPRKILDSGIINGFGWKPEVALEQGLEEAVRYYSASRPVTPGF